MVRGMTAREPFELALPRALLDIQVRSSKEPIRFPLGRRVFPTDFPLMPPPVVQDANRFRDDILYACSCDQRTVLITAANAGLIRLFCAPAYCLRRHNRARVRGLGQDQGERLRHALAEFEPGARAGLLRVLTATSRVRADVIRQFFESSSGGPARLGGVAHRPGGGRLPEGGRRRSATRASSRYVS